MKSNTRKSVSGRGASRSGVHKSTGGAPRGNGNAKKRLPWLASYDLGSLEGIQSFLREVVKHTWIGDLGTRQASALNSTCGLLLQYDQDIRDLAKMKETFEEMQAEHEIFKRQSLLGRKPFPIDEQWIQTLTEDEQVVIARAIARCEKQNSLPIEDQVALKRKELEATPGAFDTGDQETLSKSNAKSARQRRKSE